MSTPCPHARTDPDGVCLECRACTHHVVLNRVCLHCGAVDPPVTNKPSSPAIVPAERLKRR